MLEFQLSLLFQVICYFLNWNYHPGRISEEIAKKLNLTQSSAQMVHVRVGEIVRDAQARGAWEVYGFWYNSDMNKTELLKQIKEKANLSDEQMAKVGEVLDGTFFAGQNNHDKIVESLQKNLNISPEAADKVYNVAAEILTGEIFNKIKNPFEQML